MGVIRISGSALLPFALQLTGKTPTPRQASLSHFRAADGSSIDSGLLLYFPAPHSFTGEDVLELQGHGGPVVMQMLLARCLDLGARLAEPGEFSRRAFLNGKMDLAQAEAVLSAQRQAVSDASAAAQPPLVTRTNADSAETGAEEDFTALVDAETKRGLSKSAATRKVVREHPAAHRQYLTEYNAQRGRPAPALVQD